MRSIPIRIVTRRPSDKTAHTQSEKRALRVPTLWEM